VRLTRCFAAVTNSPSRRSIAIVIAGTALPDLVMPANAGIHDFLCGDKHKSWAFAGMTGWVSPESR
jgi:hypothetical protein